jgi:hypothetical protein
MLQDAVADAMTVEAVPRFDEEGHAIPEERRRSMHTTMQTSAASRSSPGRWSRPPT